MLSSFEKTLIENKDKLKNHERSELTLFEAKIHEGKGDYEKAIEALLRKGAVVDDTSRYERLAENYLRLGQKDKAIENLE